jgi:hypothetical protein
VLLQNVGNYQLTHVAEDFTESSSYEASSRDCTSAVVGAVKVA